MISSDLYLNSWEYAWEHNQATFWAQSQKKNIACKEAIEKMIDEGPTPTDSSVNAILSEFGFKRVNFVLANTIREMINDPRIDQENKLWAVSIHASEDKKKYQFRLDVTPELLNAITESVRTSFQKLGLFSYNHCEQKSFEMDYEGKVLVLSPDILKEQYWQSEYQLWLALDGFGCSPNAFGRSIRSVCLYDDENTRWNRSDFLGIIQDEYLPEWAKQKLEEIQSKNISPQLNL